MNIKEDRNNVICLPYVQKGQKESSRLEAPCVPEAAASPSLQKKADYKMPKESSFLFALIVLFLKHPLVKFAGPMLVVLAIGFSIINPFASKEAWNTWAIFSSVFIFAYVFSWALYGIFTGESESSGQDEPKKNGEGATIYPLTEEMIREYKSVLKPLSPLSAEKIAGKHETVSMPPPSSIRSERGTQVTLPDFSGKNRA